MIRSLRASTTREKVPCCCSFDGRAGRTAWIRERTKAGAGNQRLKLSLILNDRFFKDSWIRVPRIIVRVSMAAQLVSLIERGAQIVRVNDFAGWGVCTEKTERNVVCSLVASGREDRATTHKSGSRKIIESERNQRPIRTNRHRASEKNAS